MQAITGVPRGPRVQWARGTCGRGNYFRAFWCSFHELCSCEANALERLDGPLLDVLGCVALGLARDQADERSPRVPPQAAQGVGRKLLFAASSGEDFEEEEQEQAAKYELNEYLALPQKKSSLRVSRMQ